MNNLKSFFESIDWVKVKDNVVCTIAFVYTLGYALGVWVHTTNNLLSTLHVKMLGLNANVIEEPKEEIEDTNIVTVNDEQYNKLKSDYSRLTSAQLRKMVSYRISSKMKKSDIIDLLICEFISNGSLSAI